MKNHLCRQLKSTNIDYYNPFTTKDQGLDGIVSIEICYQKETSLPTLLIFHSKNALKYMTEQSSGNKSQPTKNPKSLTFIFNY